MGLVGHAARVRSRLEPFRTSDTFDFGLIVCRIGDFAAFDTNRAWLYKVDHEFASIGADQLEVGRSADVLWYFANFSTGANTGEELDLSAPDRTRPAEPATVTAYQYDGQGNREPAAGVTISGAAAPAQTGPDGKAVVTFADQGFSSLRGTRDDDIPAAPEQVCVASNLSDCPVRLGERYVGTNQDDLIRATDGADDLRARDGRDVVEARDEDDRIDVRGGGGDTVDCGGGRDVVDASSNDRLERNCEVRR
jgi:hypothetical protein